MKVIYDISVLGEGYYNPSDRTGVFRVIENLAFGLLNSKECNLCFCSTFSAYNLFVLVACLDYLEANPTLGKVPLPHSKIRRIIQSQIKPLSKKIDTASGIERLFLKLARKPLLYNLKIVESFTGLIDFNSLAEADIFHSPAKPIPKDVRQTNKQKNFLTVHDLIPIIHPKYFQFNNAAFLKQTLSSLKSQDWAICVSQSTKNDLCNYLKNLDPSRVFVTHLAAASEIFYPCSNSEQIRSIREKYNIPTNVSYILSLSTLEPRKNIDHVIRCFAKLVQEQNIKDLYLVLVGTKGWSYNQIFAELANFDLAKDRIILTGYVADEDLAALYSGALAFAYLSFYEGFGLPPLEAMQCATPVITSNTSSLPEVVGDAGIMLDPLDVDGLCQSMLAIYSSSSLREEMSMKSIEQAKKFSWQKCTQETLTAYKTALSS